MSTSGGVESPSTSVPGSAAGSPRSKVKFLCSHGGKILPRPADGHLKYVGGETRVISVPRTITFTDLMKKLNNLIDGDVTLKYQLIPEELDALVTVKSDEDLRHMFDEYDRHELTGTPRLRTFLFPANPIVIDNQIGPMDRHSLEQRYINSVNGIVFNPIPTYNNNNNNNNFRPPAVNTSQTSFTISSACSSPRTPPETAIPTVGPDAMNHDINGFRKLGGGMTRARSSPSLCNLGSSPQTSHKNQNHISTLNLGYNNQQYNYYHYQHRQPPPPPPPHHYHPHPHHYPQPYPKPPLDPSPHKSSGSGSDHFTRMRSSGVSGVPDYYRHPMDHSPHTPPNPYVRSSRGAHVVYQRGSGYEEYYANNRYDRESPPGSPLGPAPVQSNYVPKWDSVGGR